MNQNLTLLHHRVRQELTAPRPLIPRTLGAHARFALARVLGKHRLIDTNKFSWHTAWLLHGLEAVHRQLHDDEDALAVSQFMANIDRERRLGRQWLVDVDQAMHGYSLIYFERYDPTLGEFTSAMRTYLLDDLGRAADGSLPYRQSEPNLILVDTVGMICPFLARYGHSRDDSVALQLSSLQMHNYLERGLDPKTGLPHHAYAADSGERRGSVGWGRGIGWLAVGLIDSLEFFPRGDEKQSLSVALREIMSRVLDLVDDDGFLHVRLLDRQSPVDSSATAMVGYAFVKGMALGIMDTDSVGVAVRMRRAIESCLGEDGLIYKAQGDTIAVGRYAQASGSTLAQGMGLSFLSRWAHDLDGG